MQLKYECPECNVKSYSKYWNAATRKKYGQDGHGEIGEIQEKENNSYHICPECQKESEWFRDKLIIIPSK